MSAGLSYSPAGSRLARNLRSLGNGWKRKEGGEHAEQALHPPTVTSFPPEKRGLMRNIFSLFSFWRYFA